MSVPPGFVDELRSRLTLSDIVGRKVTWDRRRSNPAKGDWWAPCPFHHEKTASFHVDDRKGFYYCFGCQAKGDLIGFVRETENLDFVAAIEVLAREAGLEMPAAAHDPRAGERRDRRGRLADVMEEAVRAFGRAFRAGAGQGARDYARRRGLTEATLKRFEIGFAPPDRHFLSAPLREKGLLDDAVAAGMVIVPEDGGAPFDRFRDRLMFPIRDPAGRCIAFGGRAMSPEARAKYLNSPETELFHKGRTLYNCGPAREAAGKAGSLIVAEGYMDVIGLVQAGFDHAVAPLGTAITAEQLGLLWRIADEPVIALDGDRAGLDAADRLVDLALPLLAPGRSLGFCLLPEGQDPDDLIRAGGAPAMTAVLAAAVPLVEMLWRRETARAPLDTPERRAALDKRLREVLGRMADPGVRNHYAAELRARRAALLHPAAGQRSSRKIRGRSRRNEEAMMPTEVSRRSILAIRRGAEHLARKVVLKPARIEEVDDERFNYINTNTDSIYENQRRRDIARARAKSFAGEKVNYSRIEAQIQEVSILLIASYNPLAILEAEAALENMTCTANGLGRIRDALLESLHERDIIQTATCQLGENPVAILERMPQARAANPLAPPGRDPKAIATLLEEIIERHQSSLAHVIEVAEARGAIADAEDEAWTARIRQANLERFRADTEALRQIKNDIDDEGSSFFQPMLDAELWRRTKKP